MRSLAFTTLISTILCVRSSPSLYSLPTASYSLPPASYSLPPASYSPSPSFSSPPSYPSYSPGSSYPPSSSSSFYPSPPSSPIPFSPGFPIESVIALATSLPSHSWEYGTASEALLELYDAQYAVSGSNPFPVPTILPQNSPSLSYAQQKIVIGTGANGLSNGDGAVGDPASLGVSAVLLGQSYPQYVDAAKEEVEYILGQAPRWSNGAISQRAAYAELWADFIYMAPPFLAYYGVATNNASVLRAAVEQCLLYRDALIANTTTDQPSPPTTHPAAAWGLWIHILGPVSMDPGIWSTGNAWAAAGMTRVLATVLQSSTGTYQSLVSRSWQIRAARDLTLAIRNILDAAQRLPTDGCLLRNYLDDLTWFGETSGTALLASVAYRLAVISSSLPPSCSLPGDVISSYIQWAENIRLLFGSNNQPQHITANGTVTPAINPLDWGDRQPWTAGSPEGQNFVVLMYAAWRDCVQAQVCPYP